MALPARSTRAETTQMAQHGVPFPVREEGVRIGAKLKALRQARGLSMQQVALAVGVNKSFISKLEADAVAPSVATLLRYCEAVGIRPGSIFDPPPTQLVRRDEAVRIDLGGEKMTEYLISGTAQKEMMALRSIIEPGGGSGAEPYALRAQADLVHVLSGALEITVDGTIHRLVEGDTLTFPPTLPHSWRNPSDTDLTHALWVIVPPP
ncbi:cupin domain-containing protein [Humitalea sp. 24SJ18S-53]|uniref:cupin domain-containing protein n=1 Tax=Humitalea sp. 24SJ18S-53 TaxID=3422307 RepID=UPI003D673202